MAEDLKLSTAEEVAAAEATKLIALPMAKAGGKPIVVEIRAVPALVLLAALEGVPQAGEDTPAGDRTLSEVRKILEEAQATYCEVAKLGLKAPGFSFGEREPGKPHWGSLPSVDQAFISNAIVEFSGLGGGSREDAAAGNFPAALGAGRQDGGRADGSGSPADGADS